MKKANFATGLPTLLAVSLVITLCLGGTGTTQTQISPQEKRAGQIDLSDNIEIGTVVPANGPLADMGQAVKSVLAAAFTEANLQGGINERHLELKVIETGETPASTRVNIERLLKNEKIFAFVGAFIAGAEAEITSLMREQEVPLVGPLTLNPQSGVPLNRHVFYLLSGNPGQARALVSFVSNRSDARRPTIAVLYSSGQLNDKVVEAIKEESRKENLNTPPVYEYQVGSFDPSTMVSQLKEINPGSVFFVGRSEDLNPFLTHCEKVGWFPQILLQAGGAGSDIFAAPVGFQGKLLVTMPSSPADVTGPTTQEFQALVEKYKLPAKHRAAQISAYAAAKILIEGLKKAGLNLTRERLIQMLETFNEYQTGLTPNITYGPNRRIGAMGAYVVMIDLKEKTFVPASGWISVN